MRKETIIVAKERKTTFTVIIGVRRDGGFEKLGTTPEGGIPAEIIEIFIANHSLVGTMK